jgi:hypothetical protein
MAFARPVAGAPKKKGFTIELHLKNNQTLPRVQGISAMSTRIFSELDGRQVHTAMFVGNCAVRIKCTSSKIYGHKEMVLYRTESMPPWE